MAYLEVHTKQTFAVVCNIYTNLISRKSMNMYLTKLDFLQSLELILYM